MEEIQDSEEGARKWGATRAAAVGASLLLHGLLFLALLVVPARPKIPVPAQERWLSITWLDFETPDLAQTPPESSELAVAPDSVPPAKPPQSEVGVAQAVRSQHRANGPAAQLREGARRNVRDAGALPSSAKPAPPRGSSKMLNFRRDGSPPPMRPSPRVLALGRESHKAAAVRRVEHPFGLAPPSSSRPKVKEIEGYRFVREAGGWLTYRDPAQDFIAVLRPDGDLEFETRGAVGGGACLAGVCVMAGGLRNSRERKRKVLNRVRVRLTGVPLGIGGQFGSKRGISQKQLKLMQATFETRFRMKLALEKKRLAKLLRNLPLELYRVWRSNPRDQAKKVILSRALDLEAPQKGSAKGDDRTQLALDALHTQQKAGIRVMCARVLKFVRRNQAPTVEQGFGAAQIEQVQRHCAGL